MGAWKGVEMREKSIRVGFTLDGKWTRETLDWPPTPANGRKAHQLLERVRKAIKGKKFVYGDFFPNSTHAKTKADVKIQTFGECCDTWLLTKGRLAKRTITQYTNALEVWKLLLGAKTPISEITHTKVATKVGSHRWASAKLLNNYLVALRGVFALFCRELKIDNPMSGIVNSRHQVKKPDPFTMDEMEDILAWFKGNTVPAVWAYFEFAFMTGMRPEEIIALKWDDIDYQAEVAMVQRAKTAGIIGPLKTYRARDVDLVKRAMGAIATMKALDHCNEFIFINPETKEAWRDTPVQRYRYWVPALKATGIRYRRAYCCRHTYATNALSNGVNPNYISRQLGHVNTTLLLTAYSRWIDGADKGRERAKLEAATSRGPFSVPDCE